MCKPPTLLKKLKPVALYFLNRKKKKFISNNRLLTFPIKIILHVDKK